ncbi:hypothetical protein V8F06_001175 [Rhypophila decipiens]
MGEADGVEVHTHQRNGGSSATTSTTTVAVEEHPDAPIQDTSRVEELEADSSPPTPRFIQDEGTWKKWKWVPYPVRRFCRAGAKWARGPPNPRDHKIEPLLPQIQHAPILLFDKFVPQRKHRIWLLIGYFAVWIVTFALVIRQGLSVSEIEGWGLPSSIGCGAAYWASGNGCGLDGADCRPFSGSGFAFRCPANCASYSVLNPRAVGSQEVIYEPLIVGGPPAVERDATSPVYRGDSFICGAAVHAGMISNLQGGCGVVRLVGTQRNFNASSRNGISSYGFDSYFPLSITFEPGIECSSRDMRWPLLAVSVVFSVVLSLFVTHPGLFFFPIFVSTYWTVGMATDPPSHTNIPSLFSREIGNFLPAMLAAWVMYDKMGIRRTLTGLTAQIEKTVLWLGACWVGALTNHTFDFIPIQRLTPHDLQQQPGARAALAIIILVLLAIVASQIWFFRQEGRLIRHLELYALFVGGLIVCLVLPDLKLRIHHYILALLLLPGTSMQTRPSLLYQGLLIGFFVNGIARWGWDPILQTAYALQGDAQLGSPLPTILAPIIDLVSNSSGSNSSELVSSITFSWLPPPGIEYDGISVLVNDVERYRRYFTDDGDLSNDAGGNNFTWTRKGPMEGFENEYFRFAWMEGSSSEDYTKAGVWNSRGEWEDMAPGPSRVRLHIKTVYPNPPESTTAIMIVFHGLGDNEDSFATFARNLNLPGVLGISVRGTSPLPTALFSDELLDAGEGGMPGGGMAKHFHWGDDLRLDSSSSGGNGSSGKLDQDPGFEKARSLIMNRLVGDVLIAKCGWEMEDILLFGFGQGGSLALGLASMLRAPATSTGRVEEITDEEEKNTRKEKAFKGAVSIGGPLPTSMVPTIGSRAKAETPILICHGRESEAVDEDAVELARDEFEHVKIVEWKNRAAADDGMPRNRDEVLPMMQFIAERLRSGWS